MKNTFKRPFSYFGYFQMFTSNYVLNTHFKIMMFLKISREFEQIKPFSSELNIAKIIPIHKKESQLKCSNINQYFYYQIFIKSWKSYCITEPMTFLRNIS